MPGPGEPVRLQPLVRARVASLGEPGRRWVEGLPAVLAELGERWSLTLGRSLPGGSASYLAAAVRADGTDAVLKVSVLPIALQADVLARAGGRGYVRLLAVDPSRDAMLLERLEGSLDDTSRTPEDQVALLGETLARAWLPPDRPPYDKAATLAADLRERQARSGGAVRADVLERALTYADHLRTPDPADLVVCHGDPHPGNLLRVRAARPGAETGWCFVDCDPFVADRAYDLGVAVRDFSVRLLREPDRAADRVWSWCERVAKPSGADPARVWAWGFLERVSTGAFVTSFGATRVGEPFLRSAELLVDAGPPVGGSIS